LTRTQGTTVNAINGAGEIAGIYTDASNNYHSFYRDREIGLTVPLLRSS